MITIEASDSKNRGLINVLNMGKSINIYSMVLKILKDIHSNLISSFNYFLNLFYLYPQI